MESQVRPPLIDSREPSFLRIETPNAASFSKFIDNPVSLYTGSPDVSIDLFELKDGVISLPLTLRYNSSGIKVEEEASWVGLGWNLSVGGVITKHTVGKDDACLGGKTSDYLDFINILNFCGRHYLDSYCAPVYTKELYDRFGEKLSYSDSDPKYLSQLNPDVYYYSYPGGSGKFIIDYRDDKPYLLDKENGIKVLINLKTSGSADYQTFSILTEEGIEHYFKLRTSIFSASQNLATTSKNYTLDYSEYPNGQRVDYSYTTVPYHKWSLAESYTITTNNNPKALNLGQISNYSTLTSSEFKGEEFVLTKIQTTNYIIKFETSDREDIEGQLKLDRVTIEPKLKNENSAVRQIIFNHDYFRATSSNGKTSQYLLNRLKLNSIYYLDKTTKLQDNRYDFYYDTEALPTKQSYAVDYWGYYNGQTSNKYLLPNTKFLYYGIFEKIQKIYDVFPSGGAFFSNRASDEKSTKAGMLKGIKYPTGGYREFEYELNSFVDYFIPTVSEIRDSLSFDVHLFDQNANINDKRTYSFDIKEETDLVINLSLSKGFNSWSSVRNSKFSLFKKNKNNEMVECMSSNPFPSGSSIQELESKNTPKVSRQVKYTLTEEGSYQAVVNFPKELGDQSDFSGNHGMMTADFSIIRPIKTKESRGCGLRIKKIISYKGIDKKEILLSTNYEYKDEQGSGSSGILHEKAQYYRVENGWYYITPRDPISISRYQGYIEHLYITSYNQLSNPYRSVPSVAYSRVKESQLKNGSQGYTVYKFKNIEPLVPGSGSNTVRIDDPLNGKLLERSIYNNSDKLISRENYEYYSELYHPYFGINITYNVNPYNTLFNSNYVYSISNIPMQQYSPLYFNIIAHPLDSYNIYLKKKISTIDGITSTEEYSYNTSTHQLQNRLVRLGQNETLEERYYYPNNFTDSEYYYMTQANIISPKVEIRKYRNGYYIGGSVTDYERNFPKTYRISAINSKCSDIPIHKNRPGVEPEIYPSIGVSYNEYDPYYNVVSVTYKDAMTVIYLWSYGGQYPIAQIKNATYEDVKKYIIDISALSVKSEPTDTDLKAINNLRTKLPNAFITTYTYKPLLGMITATDPRGIITYYDYDDFGRLKEIYQNKDGIKNIIESYKYNLSNK